MSNFGNETFQPIAVQPNNDSIPLASQNYSANASTYDPPTGKWRDGLFDCLKNM